MIVNTILWFGIVATFFTNVRLRKLFMKYKTMMNRVVGGGLVALGVTILVKE